MDRASQPPLRVLWTSRCINTDKYMSISFNTIVLLRQPAHRRRRASGESLSQPVCHGVTDSPEPRCYVCVILSNIWFVYISIHPLYGQKYPHRASTGPSQRTLCIARLSDFFRARRRIWVVIHEYSSKISEIEFPMEIFTNLSWMRYGLICRRKDGHLSQYIRHGEYWLNQGL